MNEEKMTCPNMNVNRIVNILSAGYTKVVLDGCSIQKMPAVMLWGPPGVGKSQGIRQIADKLEKNTGKRVIVTDVRLVLFNPVDLRGIPTFDSTRSFAIWLKPKIFDMDASANVINILFLDEISAAPPSVQAAAYQIALDRRIGEHKLPENCAVLAAGNRMSDKSVAFKMPRALANRMMHFEVLPDLRSWIDWATKNGVDKRVIGFLSFRKDWFIEKDDSNAVSFPTPRSWEMVSDILRFCEPDIKKAKPMIEGLVGVAAGSEFASWCNVYGGLPSIEAIFDSGDYKVPNSSDQIYALVSAVTDYAKGVKTDEAKMANSIKFARKLPKEYSYLLFRSYMALFEDAKHKLMSISGFNEWLNEVGGYFGGSN